MDKTKAIPPNKQIQRTADNSAADLGRHGGNAMMTDTEIKVKGFEVLTRYMGLVEAEKFVSLIQREPFDYTEWRKKLWPDKTVREISREAMEYRRTMDKKSI